MKPVEVQLVPSLETLAAGVFAKMKADHAYEAYVKSVAQKGGSPEHARLNLFVGLLKAEVDRQVDLHAGRAAPGPDED